MSYLLPEKPGLAAIISHEQEAMTIGKVMVIADFRRDRSQVKPDNSQ